MTVRTSEQFALRCCGLTLGIGLMLPDISWLRPLGLLVVVAADNFLRFEPKTSMSPARLFVILVLIMSMVLLELASWDSSAQHNIAPKPWFAVLLVAIWVWGLTTDYRKWKVAKKEMPDA